MLNQKFIYYFYTNIYFKAYLKLNHGKFIIGKKKNIQYKKYLKVIKKVY